MDEYLRTYRKLCNGDVLELLDLSATEASMLKNRWKRRTYDNREWYESPDGKMMLLFDEGDALIYPSVEVLNMIKEVGFVSCSHFFVFCPSFETFVTNKEQLIRDLLQNLEFDSPVALDTKQRIAALETALQEKRFTERQALEKLFLGILAYCGDTLCNTLGATWACADEGTAEWEPVVRTKSGRLIRAFADLHENMLFWLEDHFFPMLGMRTDLEVEKTKPLFYKYNLNVHSSES